MARPSLKRSNSESTSSTLSCITVANNHHIASATPSTEYTDSASILSNKLESSERSSIENRRVKRVRVSNGTFFPAQGRNALEGRSLNLGVAKTPDGSIVDSGRGQGNLQDLEVGGSIIVKRADKKQQKSGGLKIRKSSRLDGLEISNSPVVNFPKAPGKAGKGTITQGKMKRSDRRKSLRPRVSSEPRVENSREHRPLPSKKPEELKQPEAPAESKPKSKPGQRVKRWLSQGLYVGQDPDFDARLSETKNKLKRASKGGHMEPQRKHLPLPMFAGQRTLERGRDFKLAFNIFSPLPPGQPKPEEWRKTQKNVFVGDAAQVWKVTKQLEASTCICEPDSGCDERCFNRFMFYECDDNNCNIAADRCTNRSFEDLRKRCKAGGKYNIGVEVMRTLDRGYGVRSNRTFEPNQIIVEYAGEIITQDECDNRMRTLYKDNECYYLMSFDQNMIIDATRGSIARFINHSCEPNCKMVKWTVAGKPRMALFAGDHGITTGEELTYDYNFDPFSSKNLLVCKCGSSKCRGFLGGPKPKEIKLTQSTTSGTKRKFKKMANELTKSTGAVKKRKLLASSTITTKESKRRNGTITKTQLKTSSKVTTTFVNKARVAKHIRTRAVSSFSIRKAEAVNKPLRSSKSKSTRRVLRR
ncbi:MAG: hypothetical protein MMC33_008822 [Icmadophila ericetorum]|nr:hypothetical protein [Icmadophila ericetorum]